MASCSSFMCAITIFESLHQSDLDQHSIIELGVRDFECGVLCLHLADSY